MGAVGGYQALAVARLVVSCNGSNMRGPPGIAVYLAFLIIFLVACNGSDCGWTVAHRVRVSKIDNVHYVSGVLETGKASVLMGQSNADPSSLAVFCAPTGVVTPSEERFGLAECAGFRIVDCKSPDLTANSGAIAIVARPMQGALDLHLCLAGASITRSDLTVEVKCSNGLWAQASVEYPENAKPALGSIWVAPRSSGEFDVVTRIGVSTSLCVLGTQYLPANVTCEPSLIADLDGDELSELGFIVREKVGFGAYAVLSHDFAFRQLGVVGEGWGAFSPREFELSGNSEAWSLWMAWGDKIGVFPMPAGARQSVLPVSLFDISRLGGSADCEIIGKEPVYERRWGHSIMSRIVTLTEEDQASEIQSSRGPYIHYALYERCPVDNCSAQLAIFDGNEATYYQYRH